MHSLGRRQAGVARKSEMEGAAGVSLLQQQPRELGQHTTAGSIAESLVVCLLAHHSSMVWARCRADCGCVLACAYSSRAAALACAT